MNEAARNIVGQEEGPQRNCWFDKECLIILEDVKRAYSKMVSRNTRQNEQECKDKSKQAHKILRQKKRVMFKSKLEQKEIACNNHEAKQVIRK